jgi:hypothetical protein
MLPTVSRQTPPEPTGLGIRTAETGILEGPGRDEWLAEEIAAGLGDVAQGRTRTVEDVRLFLADRRTRPAARHLPGPCPA